MPTVCVFYGITIRMFFNDHAPPHFHARYGGLEATVDIERLHVMQGELPRRALELVLDWTELHRAELLENWRLCMQKQRPHRIDPLA